MKQKDTTSNLKQYFSVLMKIGSLGIGKEERVLFYVCLSLKTELLFQLILSFFEQKFIFERKIKLLQYIICHRNMGNDNLKLIYTGICSMYGFFLFQDFQLLICILRFTSLLIEHSFSRHLYNSMEHLLVLLESNDMSVVLEVLNLLYMFSKRSNFITRLKPDEKECLLSRLQYLAEVSFLKLFIIC